MNLQINDTGEWRPMVAFTEDERSNVMDAAAKLLRSLRQPHSVMRIAYGSKPLYYCSSPDYLWSIA